MRISLHAVGRMKAGPERDLASRYLERLAKAGPAIGLELAGLTEIAESRLASSIDRMREEAGRLESALDDKTALILLDERGKAFSSPDFAKRLGQLRDAGTRTSVFAIGGPDGHDERLRQRATLVWSLSPLTWPHQLARIMLAEQLYRAVTVLSGHPYHRV